MWKSKIHNATPADQLSTCANKRELLITFHYITIEKIKWIIRKFKRGTNYRSLFSQEVQIMCYLKPLTVIPKVRELQENAYVTALVHDGLKKGNS